MNIISSDKKWFKVCLKDNNLVAKLEKIKLIVSDIDGALTDGYLYISGAHPEDVIKNFSVQDGYAITQAIKNNLMGIAFVSGRNDRATQLRAQMLGIHEKYCAIGLETKLDKIKEIQNLNNIKKEETILYGDDFIDFQAKNSAELLVCPANAPFYIQDFADLILPKSSDNNSFRLLIDLILYIQEKHFAQNIIKKSLELES